MSYAAIVRWVASLWKVVRSKGGAMKMVLLLAAAVLLIGAYLWIKSHHAMKVAIAQEKERNATLQIALVNKDKELRTERAKAKSSKSTKYNRKQFDPATGNLIDEINAEAAEAAELDAYVASLTEITPNVGALLAAPVKPCGISYYPLGLALDVSRETLHVGPTWRLLPRIALPLVPDLSLVLGVGIPCRGGDFRAGVRVEAVSP